VAACVAAHRVDEGLQLPLRDLLGGGQFLHRLIGRKLRGGDLSNDVFDSNEDPTLLSAWTLVESEFAA
jgi:hypothetical protein